MMSPYVDRILLNNTGDMYIHPQRKEIWEFIETHHNKPVIMTTNAAKMDYVPKVDFIAISFNGGTKESYEYTTGLPFEKTIMKIRSHYPELAKRPAEIHCLIWDGNEGTEDQLKELWKDFPGRVRLSYKYDNQFKEDHTVKKYKKTERIPCDYLGMLSIMPSGQVVSCAHDFVGITDYGNIFYHKIADIVTNRLRKEKRMEHFDGEYTGLCEKCNYNTALDDRIIYIK